ncbi:MAG: hypothetical protein AUK28_02820 [Desulfobacterales bacterium CG2_30_60_27]|nr:MAG: hypothetical protein AUK28_02820 [Desulfobacterales bacterium CG2_30_60_27]
MVGGFRKIFETVNISYRARRVQLFPELWLIRMSLLQKSWKMFFVIPTKVEIQSFQAVARNLDSRLGGNDGMSRFFTNEPEPFN